MRSAIRRSIAACVLCTGAAAAPDHAVLTIETDHTCQLAIDGRETVMVSAGEARRIELPVGDALLECRSTQWPELRHRSIEAVSADQRVSIALADQATRLAEQQLQSDARFELRDGGYWDRDRQVHWAEADSGVALNWHQATAHCADKGEGWRLPSTSELQSLSRITVPMRMTFRSYWTHKRVGDDAIAAFVPLARWRDDHVGSELLNSALCVR